MKKDIDIIDFVNEWLDTNGVLKEKQDIIIFVEQLQKQISQMDYSIIVHGYDISNGGWNNAVRLEGGSCGYGTFPALDDFVSAKLMGEATGVSNNIIIQIKGGLRK